MGCRRVVVAAVVALAGCGGSGSDGGPLGDLADGANGSIDGATADAAVPEVPFEDRSWGELVLATPQAVKDELAEPGRTLSSDEDYRADDERGGRCSGRLATV